MIDEIVDYDGRFEIKYIDSKTKEVVKEEVVYNRLLDTALNEMAKAIASGTNNMVIEYLGLGTNTATILNTVTNLGSETFRTVKAVESTISNIGEVRNVFYILPNEAGFNIKEMGVWCGTTATSTIGTGKLLSIVAWNYDRTSVAEKALEIQITRYDTFSRSNKTI